MNLDELNKTVAKLAAHEKFLEAAEVYRQAIEEHPGDPALLCNYAGILNKCGEWDKVIEMCGRVIAEYPQVPQIFNALGLAHWCKHKFVEAISAFQVAAEMLPEFHMPKHNLGTLYLMLGHYEQGWWGHDFRFAAKGRNLRYKSELLWDGKTKIPELVVWGEQGVGDEILQLTMARDLLAANLVGHIVWECEPRLREIFARTYRDIEFIDRHERVMGRYGNTPPAHLPASSLGRLFRQSAEDFTKTPFVPLKVTPFPREVGRKRIGISWHSAKAQYARWKSSPLSAWAPLLGLDAEFFTLQYGDNKEADRFPQVQRYRPLDMTEDLNNLARLVASCDLVVTVSNTTAHLAAAIGVPTIVLVTNEAPTPWCWGMKETTPWYPAASIMRRAPGESWDELLQRVALEVGSRLI